MKRLVAVVRLRVGVVVLVGVSVPALGGLVFAGASPAASSRGRVTGRSVVRVVPVAGVAGGRVRSRRARLFVPVSAAGAAGRVGAGIRFGRELTRLRTARSDTYATGSGGLFTKLFPFPVNYRDSSGSWAPIDNSLVQNADGSYSNAANSFGVQLPSALGSSPVRFSSGSAWVSFSLQGAQAPGSVSGNVDRFDDALPDTSVAYTVGNVGLDEALTVHGSSAPASFTYSIAASAGLSAESMPGGEVAFEDQSGVTQFTMAPARMWAQGNPGQQQPVKSSLTSSSDGSWQLTLTPDASFVSSVVGAGGSVVIDPSVFPGTYTYLQYGNGSGPVGDCQLDSQTPTTSDCGGTTDYVSNSGTDVDHMLLQFDIADNIPRNAEVEEVELAAPIDYNASSSTQQVGVYQTTHSWTQSATWDTYDGTHSWTTAGGDSASSPADTAQIAPSATTAYWYPHALVQGWVDGTIANDGFMIKAVGSGTLPEIGFDSSFSSSPPFMGIAYEPKVGAYRGYTLDTQQLTDRSSEGVNVANGNLLVSNDDLNIAGTAGDDLTVGRYYNNLDPTQGSFGRGWMMTPGADIQLGISGDAHTVYYRGDTGAAKSFFWNGTSWTAPPGLDAVLTQTSSTTWSLHFNASDTTDYFTGPGGTGDWGALLTSVVDRNGNTIAYSYNGANQLATITDTQGRHTTVSYNSAGYVSQITDSSSPVRTWKYYQNSSGELTSYVDPAGNTTYYSYDSDGNLTQIKTPAGNITKFAYANEASGDNRVTSVTRLVHPTDTTGPTRSYAYYTSGSPCSTSDEGRTVETNELTYSTTYCYGPSDAVDKTVDPDGHVRTATYTADGNVLSLTSPLPGTIQLGYQNTGTTDERVTSVQQGGTTGPKWLGHYNDSLPDRFAPDKVTDPQTHYVTYGQDTAGNENLITDQLATQNHENLDYNTDGTLKSSTDADGNTTHYYYTGGNLTEIEAPDASHLGDVNITPDSESRISKLIDGKGQEQDYAYDALDRVKTVTYKNASGSTFETVSYTYDKDGNLQTRTDSAGTTHYYYDGLNRMTSETFPDGSSDTYTYDAASNLHTLTDGGGTVTYVDNKENLPTSIQDANGTTTISYNTDGTRYQVSYPNGAGITYGYATDSSGRLTSVADTMPTGISGGETFTYSYTNPTTGANTGLWQKATLPTGNTATYTYDSLNRLTDALTKTSSGSTVSDYQYTLDGNGNLLKEVAPSATTTYDYNEDNQTCWSTTGGGTGTCSSPPTGADSYTYDLNGNLTSNGGGLTLSYNPLDQTSAINGIADSYYGEGQLERVGAGSATFQNDLLGLSRRSEGGDTYFTRDTNGDLVDLRTPSGNYYPLVDGEGSIVGYSNSSGHLDSAYSYDPNGNQTTTTSGSAPDYFGFQNGYMTDGNLYHFGARYYDPSQTAWTQQDPLNQISDLTQDDRYGFAGDDPMNLSDSAGERAIHPRSHLRGGGLQSLYNSIGGCVAGGEAGGTAGLYVGAPEVGAVAGCLAGAYASNHLPTSPYSDPYGEGGYSWNGT